MRGRGTARQPQGEHQPVLLVLPAVDGNPVTSVNESPDLVIAMRLLDHAKLRGFQFQRVAKGPDGALLGTRHTGDWTDTLYIDGFSCNCYALRERTTSLVVPGNALVERRAAGDALNVLNAVLTWETV